MKKKVNEVDLGGIFQCEGGDFHSLIIFGVYGLM